MALNKDETYHHNQDDGPWRGATIHVIPTKTEDGGTHHARESVESEGRLQGQHPPNADNAKVAMEDEKLWRESGASDAVARGARGRRRRCIRAWFTKISLMTCSR